MIRTLSFIGRHISPSNFQHFPPIKRMSSQCSVFVTRCKEEIPAKATEMLECKHSVTYWTQPGPITRQGLLDGVVDKAAVFCLLTDKVDKEVLDAANNLKVLATMSVGHDHLDLAAIKEKNIVVGYTPDVLTDATADLTLALLLATSRRLVEGSDALKNGEWGTWSPLWLCGPELKGSTVGIVGFGRIGMAVMERLKPFGVENFLYTGRGRKEREDGAKFVSFEDLLKESDFVILTLAYTPESKDLMDKRAFKLMKKSAILVNTSRGGVVNQDDLVEALKDGEIFAAGLDVMTPEPLPTSHPLVGLPNCTLIPHLGSATIETRTEMAVMTAGNIIAGLANEKMPAQLKLRVKSITMKITFEHDEVMKNATEQLKKLFDSVGMPDSHGMGHCQKVLLHMDRTIEASATEVPLRRQLALRLASLLHEADDRKYFKNSNNAEDILKSVLSPEDENSKRLTDEVVEMISYVSASKNGNSVPPRAKEDPQFLWVRFCDRLESIGPIGAVRCWQYNTEVKAPLSTPDTPRPLTEEQVWSHVKPELFLQYMNGGNSVSMMDHYYDKLLQIAVFDPDVVRNSYLVEEARTRVAPLVKVCLEFGKTGVVPEDLIKSYIQ